MEEEKEIARRIEITRRHAANGFRWLQQPDAIVILRLAYFLLFFFPPFVLRFYPAFWRKSVRGSDRGHKNAGRARLRVGWVTRHGCFMADSFVCSE